MDKLIKRQKIRYRIRKKVAGSPDKPRLSVFRSNSEIYAQLIDDNNGKTIAAASSRDKDIVGPESNKNGKKQTGRSDDCPQSHRTGHKKSSF